MCICKLYDDLKPCLNDAVFNGYGICLQGSSYSNQAPGFKCGIAGPECAYITTVSTLVEIGTDASPWGLGGWLAIDGIITEYFTSQLTNADSEKFGIPLADACGQQVWEALAMLTAIDLCSNTWKQRRIVLKITGDNASPLTLVTKMRPPSPELAIIARELALRLVELSFPPDAQHKSGAGHVFADALSRVYSPTGAGVLLASCYGNRV